MVPPKFTFDTSVNRIHSYSYNIKESTEKIWSYFTLCSENFTDYQFYFFFQNNIVLYVDYIIKILNNIMEPYNKEKSDKKYAYANKNFIKILTDLREILIKGFVYINYGYETNEKALKKLQATKSR